MFGMFAKEIPSIDRIVEVKPIKAIDIVILSFHLLERFEYHKYIFFILHYHELVFLIIPVMRDDMQIALAQFF